MNTVSPSKQPVSGPLTGIRVVELGGIGPGPFCGMLLGDLGADVIRIDRPTEAGRPASSTLHRNRRSIAVDLKHPRGAEAVLDVIAASDAILEGFRPGVAERLGLGPEPCLARNPRLVYGRMTGWGQYGPLAQDPGHDINYIALAGALHAIAPPGGDPVPPVNLVADFGGGGMLLAMGLVSALLHARTTGQGQVVDAAMTDGVALLLSMTYGFLAEGAWRDEPGVNLIDGGAPYYGVYRCLDGGHIAVGALEPQFYAALLRVLDLQNDPDFTRQTVTATWPTMRERLTAIFATRSRDDWTNAFDGQDACVTPVLSLTEAAEHPHNTARGTHLTHPDGSRLPAPAPRFSLSPAPQPAPPPVIGSHTDEVLKDIGLKANDLEALRQEGVIR
jgi:alpha-methylacyl-CoA racemase